MLNVSYSKHRGRALGNTRSAEFRTYVSLIRLVGACTCIELARCGSTEPVCQTELARCAAKADAFSGVARP